MTITINNYISGEFEQLKEVLVSSGVYYEDTDKEEHIEAKLEHDPNSIIVARDEGNIIGTVFTIYDPWNPFIFHLGVKTEYEKKGIGSMLMQEAEKRILERGCPEMTIFVTEGNEKVHQFYQKRGWRVIYNVACLVK